MRRFEKVSRIDEEIKLPKRSTENSAGYDFYAIDDVFIEPIGHGQNQAAMLMRMPFAMYHNDIKPILVRTGVKAEMLPGEFLLLANRSSNPKKGLILVNGVGIVDSDYYNNIDNEGEIMFAFINIGDEMIRITKGDKLGQGIFMKYYLTDDDTADGERQGGFGSTGK